MGVKITWHGHANFQIQSPECSILIDPFFTGNPTAKITWNQISPPDVVLVTHMHGDHSGDAAAICKKYGSRLGAVVGIADLFPEKGVDEGQIINRIGFNIGGTIVERGVSITMTEATHTTEAGTPTGFILTFPDGFTVYHAGDTGIFATMEIWGQLYPIDVALLPTGGVFTMDYRQAALAAKLLKAKKVVPMHWGTFPALVQENDRFEKELGRVAPDCACIHMQPGETVEVN